MEWLATAAVLVAAVAAALVVLTDRCHRRGHRRRSRPSAPWRFMVDHDAAAEPVAVQGVPASLDSPGLVLGPTIGADQLLPLCLQAYTPDQIERSVSAGAGALIDALVEVGDLSGHGPITDADVRTLVFVSVATTELLDVLLDGGEAGPAAVALSLPERRDGDVDDTRRHRFVDRG